MSAYMLVQATITDRKKFALYTQAMPPLIDKFGGEYIALGAAELLEGEFSPRSALISKWQSVDAIKAFWNSDEYVEVKRLREGSGIFNVMLVEGVPNA